MVEYSSDYTNISKRLQVLKKRDRAQFEAVKKKMFQILEHPHIYKPLGNILKGKFRVHIGHFVLLFVIDEERKVVEFVDYDHHDKIYKKQ